MPSLMENPPEPKAPGQRRILALDGGGMRGVLTMEILTEIEAMLARELDQPDLVLADYFDYFAGTSTGAMIAAGLALGWPVSRAMELYTGRGHEMLKPAPLWNRVAAVFGHKCSSEHLAAAMRDEYGADTLWGDVRFRSLLLAVMHNANTSSPWPLSNNPRAKYNDPSRPDCNLRLPLWEVVRASAAAPFVYAPEPVQLGSREFVFVDGALTPYNNPALQAFVQATHPAYRLGWETGPDRLLLVSVGTGLTNQTYPTLSARQMHGLHTLRTLHGTLLSGSVLQQDLMCRVLGDCRHGAPIDREIGDLVGEEAGPREDKAFTYLRYNVSLTVEGLDELGLGRLTGRKRMAALRQVASMDNIGDLRLVGRAAARSVQREAFDGFLL